MKVEDTTRQGRSRDRDRQRSKLTLEMRARLAMRAEAIETASPTSRRIGLAR